MTYQFAYNCVLPPSDEELNYVIKHEEAITREAFLKDVNETSFQAVCHYLGYSADFRIEEDGHVTYHRSKTPEGEDVLYLQHSSIEYVFKKPA